MSAIANHDLIRGVDRWPRVVVTVRRVRHAGRDVPARDLAGERLDAFALARRLRAKLAQQRELSLTVQLLGVGDAIGQLVELTGRVALAGGHGLLAPVGLGDTSTLAAAHLDVPTKYPGKSHLERGNARLLLEPRLELHHAFGAAFAQLAELRQFGIEFRFEDLAVFCLNRRTRDQRALEQRRELGHGVDSSRRHTQRFS